MYAIVQVGGRQYRAAHGERLLVDRLPVEVGARMQLADVRMLVAEEGDGDTATMVGRPTVEGVSVAARAVAHRRGPKLLVFKYKAKKRYRRRQGFRAELTELRIEEVRLGAYTEEVAPEAAPERPRRRPRAAAAAPAQAEVAEVEAVPAEAPAKPAEPKAAPSRRRARPEAPAAVERPTRRTAPASRLPGTAPPRRRPSRAAKPDSEEGQDGA